MCAAQGLSGKPGVGLGRWREGLRGEPEQGEDSQGGDMLSPNGSELSQICAPSHGPREGEKQRSPFPEPFCPASHELSITPMPLTPLEDPRRAPPAGSGGQEAL